MKKTSIALAVGGAVLVAGIDAQAATIVDYSGNLNSVNALTGYNHLINVNGVGATQNVLDGFTQRVGLGNTANHNGTQYHHIFTNVDQAPNGTTGTVTASDYGMHDAMMPGALHIDPNTDEPTGYVYDHASYGVGQSSWCQAGTCAGGSGTSVGWNHTSNHILFSLSEASPVTITLSSAAADATKHGPNETSGVLGGDLKPGFTIYSGVSTTGTNDANHTFNNLQQPWTNVTYMDHDANTANASSITWNSVTDGPGILPAGYYSLWIGGNAANVANADGSHGKNYALTISTTTVPVPAAVWLFGSALAGMGIIGRRKDKASA